MSQDLATIRPKTGGNATVPGSAPFLPAQAFVDNITMLANPSTGGWPATFGFTNITNISLSADPSAPEIGKGDTLLVGLLMTVYLDSDPHSLDFTACHLVVSSVNGFLAIMASQQPVGNPTDWTFNLSGAGNAAPTGQGLIDKATLIAALYTVITN